MLSVKRVILIQFNQSIKLQFQTFFVSKSWCWVKYLMNSGNFSRWFDPSRRLAGRVAQGPRTRPCYKATRSSSHGSASKCESKRLFLLSWVSQLVSQSAVMVASYCITVIHHQPTSLQRTRSQLVCNCFHLVFSPISITNYPDNQNKRKITFWQKLQKYFSSCSKF